MSALTEAYVAVKPDTRDFGPQLKRQLGKVDADRAGRTVGGSFGKGFTLSTKKLLVAGAIFKGIQGLGRSMSGIWGEGTEAIKAGAQTAAVIKSTGGAAKVTAGDVDRLSAAISRQTGRDDELISAGQNMLLTFTRVRNEQGKGNDIFTQATKLSSDLAVATGKDLVGANVMLGKALNDPTRGLTALTRVGVTFDEGQRKQIKSMQEHGNIAGAQKIILAELRKEFGGSAAAQATFGEKAKVAWANVQEGIGVGLIKALDAVAPALEQIGHIATETFKVFSKGVGGSKGVFQTFADFLATHQGDIVAGFVKGGEVVLAFGEGVLRMAAGTLRAFGTMDQAVSEFFGNFLDFTGEMLHGAALAFRWLPGIGPKLRKASEDFDAFTVTAKKGYEDQGRGAFAAADKLDGFADKAAETRGELDKLGKTEVWKAKQRDAANAAAIALKDIGTNADGSQIKLKAWNKRTELGAEAQKGLENRIKAARQRMIEQRETGIKAGATQGELTKRWDKGKEALFREFKQMGLSNKAARDLTERYGKIPKHIQVKHTTPGAKNAIESAKELKRRIDGIKNKSVSLSMKFAASATAAAVQFFKSVPGSQASSFVNTFRAEGGVMPGFTPGQDVHTFRSATGGTLHLSGGEAVMRPEWTRAVGGPAAVQRMNANARSGRGPGFAGGGVLRHLNVNASHGPIPASIGRFGPAGVAAGSDLGSDAVKGLAAAALKMLNANLLTGQGITGPAGPMSTFRGGRFTSLAIKNLRRAEQIAGITMRVMQGGWRPRTSYSGTSHAGDAVDTQPSARLIRAIRAVGWASGDRTGLGNWGPHAHSVPSPSTGRARGSAVGQYRDYVRRGGARQGLRSPWGLAGGAIVHGGRGGVLAHIGEGANDEIVAPLPRRWRPPTPAARSTVVELGPKSIAAIASALTVEIDGRQVARAVRYQGLRGTT